MHRTVHFFKYGDIMKIFLEYIRAGGADELILGFLLEGEGGNERKSFVISTEIYTSICVERGEILPDTYKFLEHEAGVYAAYKRAMYILSYGACSKRMLCSKLRSKGFSAEQSEEAVERIYALGFIDNVSAARRDAERCATKLWGETRIRSYLVSRGYERDEIDSAVFWLEDSGVNFERNCTRLLHSKIDAVPNDYKERQRLIAAMLRYGYTLAQVKNALSKF